MKMSDFRLDGKVALVTGASYGMWICRGWCYYRI